MATWNVPSSKPSSGVQLRAAGDGAELEFDLQGRRRGNLKFLDWIPGASFNLQCVDGKGGGEHDVYDRVMRLFELADKHDLYVVMTEWEYQDALAHTADTRIRDEIVSVPYNDRLMLLARHYDRLLAALKKRALHKRIASVELINELNSPPIVCSAPGGPPPTFRQWVEGRRPEPVCTAEQVRALAQKAVGLLRERHPDLLVTVDGLDATHGFSTLFAYRLYPPKEWAEDGERRKKAEVPEEIGLQTKLKIAMDRIQAAMRGLRD